MPYLALGLSRDSWRVFYPRELERLVVSACQAPATTSTTTASSPSSSSSSSGCHLPAGSASPAPGGSTAAAVSFGQLLGQLFPQLNRLPFTQTASHTNAYLSANTNTNTKATASSTTCVQGEIPQTVVVTYYPHSKLSSFDGLAVGHAQHPHHPHQQQPPSLLPSDAYQTLGALSEPALTMMERLDASAVIAWHDLILTTY